MLPMTNSVTTPIKITALAELAGLSRQRIHQLINSGVIPCEWRSRRLKEIAPEVANKFLAERAERLRLEAARVGELSERLNGGN
jgi:hypothetical protein